MRAPHFMDYSNGLRDMAKVAQASSVDDSGAKPVGVLVNDTVYAKIKNRILNNQLRPGNKLRHQHLAEILGVSRTPVRESLERLYQEGFVTREVNRGYFVAEIDEVEACELYETRQALEVFELRQSYRRGISDADITRLEKINAKYKAKIGAPLSRERLLIDRDFHMALAEISGNQFLCRTLSSIFERLILKRRVDGYHDSGEKSYKEHVAFLERLRLGDIAAAEQLLGGHIEAARSRLLTFLQSEQSANLPIE